MLTWPLGRCTACALAATTAVGAAAAGAAAAGVSAAARDARLLLYRSTALTEDSAPVGATFTVDDVWKPPRCTLRAPSTLATSATETGQKGPG